MTTNCFKSVLWTFAVIQFLPFLNNTKDVTYKRNLDFKIVLEGLKLHLITKEIWYLENKTAIIVSLGHTTDQKHSDLGLLCLQTVSENW